MSDGNVLGLKTPAQAPLNELLKQGVQQLLGKAIEAELAELLTQYSDLRVDGKQASVRVYLGRWHLQPSEDGRQAVAAGADWLDSTGRKAVLAVMGGYRESEVSWPEVMEQLASQGLSIPRAMMISGV